MLSRIAACINSYDHHVFILGVFFLDKNKISPTHHCLQPWPAPGKEVVREFLFSPSMTPKPSPLLIQSRALARFPAPEKEKCKMRFASHSARGGRLFFLWEDYWGLIRFLLKKYEISNDSSFGLDHKKMAAKEYRPLKQDQPIRDNRFSPVPQYHKKTANLAAVFWGPGDSSPALVALQDYFASPPVYWSFLAAKIANKKALSEEPKNV